MEPARQNSTLSIVSACTGMFADVIPAIRILPVSYSGQRVGHGTPSCAPPVVEVQEHEARSGDLSDPPRVKADVA